MGVCGLHLPENTKMIPSSGRHFYPANPPSFFPNVLPSSVPTPSGIRKKVNTSFPRPLTGYFMFAQDKDRKCKEKHPDMSRKDRLSKLLKRWNKSKTLRTIFRPGIKRNTKSYTMNRNPNNDIYKALKTHFFMSGKGRRPDLPVGISLNHELLAQLYFLKEEGQFSFRTLKSWLEKLEPTTTAVTEGRIRHTIDTILNSIKKMPPGEWKSYLQIQMDFFVVSEPLASLGLNRLHLMNIENYNKPPLDCVTNSVVCALDQFRNRERGTLQFVINWLKRLSNTCAEMNDKQLRKKVESVLNKNKALSRSKKISELDVFLGNLFLRQTDSACDSVVEQKTDTDRSDSLKKVNHLEKVAKDHLKKIKLLEEKNKNYEEEIVLLKQRNLVLIENRNVSKENEQKLNDKIASLLEKEKQALNLKDKVCELEEKCETFSLSKSYKKNSFLKKELEQTVEQLTSANERELSLKEVTKGLETKIEALKHEITALKRNIKNEQSNKSKVVKKLRVKENEVENCKFQTKFLSNNSEISIELRESGRGRQFSEAVRLTYMALQGDANVSAENCAKIIQIVAKNFFDKDINLKDLPKSSSALNFQSEAHVIAKQQVVEEVKSSKHFTFACDGTSREKQHYLEQHIVLDNGKQLSLGFSKIASDNSDTLLESCVDIFMELCDLDKFMVDDSDTQLEKDALFKDILSKLKCLLSDRAEVMKCFDKKFAAYKENLLKNEDASTHFVYCNAHFLLGLFAAAEKAIKEIEEEEVHCGEKLGRDSCTAFYRFQDASETAALRIIRLASSAFGPRGDEKSGSRFEWLAFCSKIGVKSQFSSFRSNRFNNVFHNATALLIHKDHILTFLDGYVSNSNQKLRSIVEDLKDHRIISIIAAISLFHVFFTEPYWSLMKSSKTHGDFPHYVRKIEETLNIWQDQVDIESLCCVFDDFPAVIPPNYFSLFDSYVKVSKNFSIIVKQCQIVFKRQLKDFLAGGVFGGTIPSDVMDVLKTCPLTNLTGERLFGDLDFDKNRRRNASLFSNSAKVMWKRNRSYQWVSKQSNKTRQRLIARAVKMGPKWRDRSRKANQEVLEEVKRKIQENREQKLRKEIKAGESKREVMDWILSHGGICLNKEELDKLMKKKDRLKHVQYQIKARKLLYGETINSSGSLNTLYNRLLKHLGHDEPELEPPAKKRKNECHSEDEDCCAS